MSYTPSIRLAAVTEGNSQRHTVLERFARSIDDPWRDSGFVLEAEKTGRGGVPRPDEDSGLDGRDQKMVHVPKGIVMPSPVSITFQMPNAGVTPVGICSAKESGPIALV